MLSPFHCNFRALGIDCSLSFPLAGSDAALEHGHRSFDDSVSDSLALANHSQISRVYGQAVASRQLSIGYEWPKNGETKDSCLTTNVRHNVRRCELMIACDHFKAGRLKRRRFNELRAKKKRRPGTVVSHPGALAAATDVTPDARTAANVTPRRWCSAEGLQPRTEAGRCQLQSRVRPPKRPRNFDDFSFSQDMTSGNSVSIDEKRQSLGPFVLTKRLVWRHNRRHKGQHRNYFNRCKRITERVRHFVRI